jgi:biopolymer transport protein ExbD
MPRFKRNIPTINATSSADIAFILLLFFLLTGSLNPTVGIFRKLLPNTSEVKLKKKKDIEKRDFLTFTIDGENKIFMEGVSVDILEIREIAKIFISNPDNADNLPRKTLIDIPELGKFQLTPDAVINLEVSRDAEYKTYLRVLGELSAAYDELRNELSEERFEKPFNRLTEERQNAIREVYPLRIAEKELMGKEASHE